MTTFPDSLVRFEHELQEAIRVNTGGSRSRLRRPVVLRAATAGLAAAAVALGVLSVLPGGGPSAVERAAAALAVQGGAILHVDVTVTDTDAAGHVSTWEDDSWQQQSAPYDRRDVETSSTGPRVERAVTRGVARVYDPRTNTIYTAPSTRVPPAAVPNLVPILSKIAARLAGTAHGIVPAPGAAAAIAAARGQTSPTELFRTGLLALLRSGAVVAHGETTVHGRTARVFGSRDGSITYLADAKSYLPIRFAFAKGGNRLTIDFRSFEQVGDGEGRLLSLRAQHPGAHVDTSPAGYAAALPHLYPHG